MTFFELAVDSLQTVLRKRDANLLDRNFPHQPVRSPGQLASGPPLSVRRQAKIQSIKSLIYGKLA